MNRVEVHANSTVAEVTAAFETNAAVTLAPELEGQDLESLLRRHVLYERGSARAQVIVQHPSATAATCQLVMDMYGSNVGAVNAVATCGRATPELLARLSTHSSPSVREHAAVALVRKEVATATPEWIDKILNANKGDENPSIAIRYMLAASSATPVKVLQILSQDDSDFIASAADEQLSQKVP